VRFEMTCHLTAFLIREWRYLLSVENP